MKLSSYVVLDPDSGTFFGADRAVLLDTTRLSSDELALFNEGSDSDRWDIAEPHAQYLEDLIPDDTAA